MVELAGIHCQVICDTHSEVRYGELLLPEGTTLADALRRISAMWPDLALDWSNVPVGVWGQRQARTQALQQGDRIEIYRTLPNDPRVARRRRAADHRQQPARRLRRPAR